MTKFILAPKSILLCSGLRVAIDVETTGLKWYSDKLIGVGLWCPDASVYGYIPTLTDKERNIAKSYVQSLEEGTTVIAHNAKFDLHFLGADPAPWEIIDPSVAIHLLDSRHRKGLVEAEAAFLGTTTKRDLINRQPLKIRKKIWEWPMMDTAQYCINDTRVEYKLAELLLPWIDTEGLSDLFYKEMQYLKLIWRIEHTGVQLDFEFVARAKKLLQAQLKALEEQLFEAVGYEFNWNSHPQLSRALYEDMGFPRPVNPFTVSRFNKDGGKYNSTLTSTFILMEKAKHPLGELVSAIRETKKMINYLNDWLGRVDEEGYLHTDYNLTGTRTGRLSSGKPNLQNVPAETRGHFTQAMFSGSTIRADEYNLRNGIIADKGHVFVSIDYKQMEMRMFGALSGDPFMLDSLNAGRDIHGDIAEQVWNTREPTQREWAKTISFGLIYGMSTGSLQFKLDLTPDKARKITDDYWSTFPRIKPWLYGTADECKENGFVTYWSGRRWVEDQEDKYFKAANALIQGGCADLLSIAAIRVDRWLRSKGWGRIVLLVHDEIILLVKASRALEVARVVSKIMEVPDLLGIPWFTDTKIGATYGSLQKVELKDEHKAIHSKASS